MAETGISVSTQIIQWILQTMQPGAVPDSAADLLRRWGSGEKQPTFRQLEAMSRKMNIPFGYFFLDRPPEEKCPVAEYRTVASVSAAGPGRNLLDTVDFMTDIQDWMTDYVRKQGQETLRYVGSAAQLRDAAGKENKAADAQTGDASARGNTVAGLPGETTAADRYTAAIAQNIRKTLSLEAKWTVGCSGAGAAFRRLRGTLEDAGVLVMMSGIVGNHTRRKLDLEEFRAFTLVNSYVPLIFINARDTENGRLFSLAHELAHIWLGENSLYNDAGGESISENKTEQLCNAIAGELLVPGDSFLSCWQQETGDTLEKAGILSKKFSCSRFVIARRACSLGLISREEYRELAAVLTEQFQHWNRLQKKKVSGGDYYRTMESRYSRRFVTALANSAREGSVSYTEAYRLTNTNRRTFARLLDRMERMDDGRKIFDGCE